MENRIRITGAVLAPLDLQPLTCRRDMGTLPVGGMKLEEALLKRLMSLGVELTWSVSLWPTLKLLEALAEVPVERHWSVKCPLTGHYLSWSGLVEHPYPDSLVFIPEDGQGVILRHTWQLLTINEMFLGEIQESLINGTIRGGATNDGILHLGEGSILLPGVYIEGTVVIGRNCKIGPNCYIRGSTVIGDNCHIGQGVEVKNSIFMDRVSAGHLSYIGDSIICSMSNLGAGTITANFRHDGKNHHSMVGSALVDTGRRKLGAMIGDNVHTGIHTSIYPGRKLWPDQTTLPGAIVQRDLRT